MKKNFKLATVALGVAVVSMCAVSCGKKKPSAADTVAVDEMVAEVVEAQTADSTDMSKYDAAFFQGSEGYQTTPSGLKYVTVVEGTGINPGPNAIVNVHYTGRLLDGTVFDSSVARGESATFPLQAVIPGWTEGLQLMKEGGKTVFYIPSDLAYGKMGTPGGPIGPDQDLIFEVELIQSSDR